MITRDKYSIPPNNYLADTGSDCYVMVGQLLDTAQYASLGLPFMKTFYTSLNYKESFVYFGLSTTVSVRGSMKLFPPIVAMYLGLTISILPGIIAAFCMEYHYCPKRKFH